MLQEIEKHNDELNNQPDFFQKERLANRKEHLAFEKKVTLKNPPNPKYGDTNTLTDGFRETADRFRFLMGFQGDDMEAILDLEKEQSIEEIKIGFIQNKPSWIFYPKEIEFLVSDDGKDFRKLDSQKLISNHRDKLSGVFYFSPNLETILKTRFIKIIAHNQGKCPEDHDGAGKNCWIFPDEIIVN